MKLELATEDDHSSLEVEEIEILLVAVAGKVEDWGTYLWLQFQREVEEKMHEDKYLSMKAIASFLRQLIDDEKYWSQFELESVRQGKLDRILAQLREYSHDEALAS